MIEAETTRRASKRSDIGHCLPVGPARRRTALAKIDDLFLRNIDPEGPNCVVLGRQKCAGKRLKAPAAAEMARMLRLVGAEDSADMISIEMRACTR